MSNSFDLDTGKKYIKDIFAADCFYNVPEYQRPFVWSENEVMEFLDDVQNALENNREKEYFIGCMIWNSKEVKAPTKYLSKDILDGQQRFITIYLLHSVIRDLSNEEQLKKKVQKRLIQEKDKYDGIPERNRIIFEIREDKEFLDKYVLKKEGTLLLDEISEIAKKDHSISVRNMAAAIIAIHGWWKEYRDSLTESKYHDFIGEFFWYLSNRVIALYLSTPDNLDDAYNLFTVLNSRGVQLEAGDILRAQNLRLIDDLSERKRLARKWTQFENTIGSPYKSFDEFLWSIVLIKMKYRSDDNQNLTKAFDFMADKKMLEKGAATFEHIEGYVNHYDKLTNDEIEFDDSSKFFSSLIQIHNSVVGSKYITPLIHYRECFGEYRVLDFLIKIDNLISVMWMTGRRSTQTRIFIILRKMEECLNNYKKGRSTKDAADSFLKSDCLNYNYIDEKASTELDINEFFEMLANEDWGNYVGAKINKTKYLLLKLDLMMGSQNTVLQFNSKSSSVEHLMPRKIKNTSWKVSSEFHEKNLHKLGNVVLVDRKKNSSMSNKGYREKYNSYKTSIETRPNTNFVFLTYDQWNEESMINNQDRIETLLKEYYLGNSYETFLKIKKDLSKSKK